MGSVSSENNATAGLVSHRLYEDFLVAMRAVRALHDAVASCSMSISGLEWRKASVSVSSPLTEMKNAG